MAVDSYDPTTGHPIFLDTGAPDVGVDPTEVAEYAAKVGTRLIGPTAEREAYEYGRLGLGWFDTSEEREYLHNGSGWESVDVRDTGWMNIPLSSGWSAVSGHTPRGRRIGNVVYLEGAIQRGAGGSPENMFTLPEPLRSNSSKSSFLFATIARRNDDIRPAELYTNGTGLVQASGYVLLTSSTGWLFPISGSFVRDQA